MDKPAPLSPQDIKKLGEIVEAAFEGARRAGRSLSDAQDDSQDVAEDLLHRRQRTKGRSLDEIRDTRSYGYMAGRNKARDAFRKPRRFELSDSIANFEWQGTPPEWEAIAKAIGAEIASIADTELSPAHRAAFNAIIESNGNLREARLALAEYTGKSPGAVKKQLQRAINSLRELMTRYDEEPANHEE